MARVSCYESASEDEAKAHSHVMKNTFRYLWYRCFGSVWVVNVEHMGETEEKQACIVEVVQEASLDHR